MRGTLPSLKQATTSSCGWRKAHLPVGRSGARTTPPSAAAAQQTVDVEAVLSKMAAAKGRPSNWKESVVNLLQLLDMGPSLAARKPPALLFALRARGS